LTSTVCGAVARMTETQDVPDRGTPITTIRIINTSPEGGHEVARDAGYHP